MKLYLLVIRVKDLDLNVEFYSNLGFALNREKHGAGPVHYSYEVDDFVLELYPCNETQSPCSSRLGFQLSDEKSENTSLVNYIESIATISKDIEEGMRYCIVVDPDGRKVELTYRKSKKV